MAIIPEVIKDTEDAIIMEEEVMGIKIIREKSSLFERWNRSRGNDRSISNSRSRSGSRASTNRDRIQWFECREYDHFA